MNLIRKTKLCLVVVSMAFHYSSIAQSKLDLGIQLSPSVERQVWLGTMDWLNFQDRTSLNFGVRSTYSLSDKLGLSSGIAIYDKGSYARVTDLSTQYSPPPLSKHVFHSWYLSAPLQLDYTIPVSDRGGLLVSAGVIYGHVVWKYTMKKVFDDVVYHNRWYDSTNKHFWGLNWGLGYGHKLSEGLEYVVRPNYVRQLNQGWELNEERTNQGRYDSLVIDLILYFDWKKRIIKKPKANMSHDAISD